MSPTAERIFDVARRTGVPERSLRSTLAKVCGISPQAVRDWAEGKTKNIKHEHLVSISRRFDVSIHWLLTGKESHVGEDAQKKLERSETHVGAAYRGEPQGSVKLRQVVSDLTTRPNGVGAHGQDRQEQRDAFFAELEAMPADELKKFLAASLQMLPAQDQLDIAKSTLQDLLSAAEANGP